MASSIIELSEYRYERAIEELDNARLSFSEGRYKLALNRSYYAIFHAMRAVNALDEFDSSKHSGIIAHFNQFHVKNGDFPKEVSKMIRGASEMREHADYEDFFIASKQESGEQIDNADTFVALVEKYLEDRAII